MPPLRKLSAGSESEFEDQRLGFYTTVFLEGENEDEVEERAIRLLRDNQEFARSILNEKTDSPIMFVEEIAELESFDGLNLSRTGFSFYREADKEANGA